MAEQPPAPLLDRGTGPAVSPGVAVELAPGVVRVTAPNPSMLTGPGTNTYLVGEGSLVVIDPGPDLPEHRASLLEAIAGREVSHLLVTHTHPDHAPGAAALGRVVGAPLAGYGPGPSFEPDLLLVDGDVVGEGEHVLGVVHTPGHAPDHLCYLLGSRRLCFTGDHVMHGSTVVIKPPDGTMAPYLANLERLASLEPPLELIAPGHGRLIGDPRGAIAEVIEHRLQRERVIAEVLSNYGPASADELVAIVYPDLEAVRLQVATVTLLAHLQHLAQQGVVISERPESDQSTDTVFSSLASGAPLA